VKRHPRRVGRGRAGDGGDGGEQIDAGDRRRINVFARGDARPVHEERYADAAFVDVAFAGAEQRVFGGGLLRRAFIAQAAVVGSDDDDGVFREAERGELFADAAEPGVEAFDHRGVGGRGASVGVAGVGSMKRVAASVRLSVM